jgi:predicted O-methyltransferase YrrM
MDHHKRKLYSFLLPKIKNIKNPNILELGVREGNSTKMFIDLVQSNKGKLFSVDVDDYGHLFSSNSWKFIKSRDDNFNFILNQIKEDLDLIFIDTTHEAKHVLKIIQNYYFKLKVGGFIIIDDISWIPYLKNKERNSLYCEINNKETYEVILNLFNANENNFDLEFTFISSGFASIKKNNLSNLNLPKQINTRKFSLKNIYRKLKNI